MSRNGSFFAGAIAILAIGLVGGYYVGWQRSHEQALTVEVNRELEAGNVSLMLMDSVVGERPEQVYLYAESRVITAFVTAHYAQRVSDETGKRFGNFSTKVIEFYSRHPTRRAALNERYSDKEVLAWIDGRP